MKSKDQNLQRGMDNIRLAMDLQVQLRAYLDEGCLESKKVAQLAENAARQAMEDPSNVQIQRKMQMFEQFTPRYQSRLSERMALVARVLDMLEVFTQTGEECVLQFLQDSLRQMRKDPVVPQYILDLDTPVDQSAKKFIDSLAV